MHLAESAAALAAVSRRLIFSHSFKLLFLILANNMMIIMITFSYILLVYFVYL